MTPYDLPLPDVDPMPPAHPARRAAVIVTPGTITYLLSIPWLVMQTLPPEKHRWLVTLCAEEPGTSGRSAALMCRSHPGLKRWMTRTLS